MKKRSRRQRRPEEILTILDEYRKSGLSQLSFSKRRGIGTSTLQYWLRKQRDGRLSRKESSGAAALSTELIEVKVVDAPPSACGDALIEFEFARGGKLRFRGDLSPEALARYAEALGHRC